MIKKEGFEGQRSVILPKTILNEMDNNPISQNLYITDIGYYPNALNHLRKRANGCHQNILLYCIDGEGWVSANGKKVEIQANQYIIIPKHTAHSYGSKNNDPWSIYWIHFAGNQASYFIESENEAKIISPSKVSRIEDRLQLFEEILLNLEMGYSMENINYANICLWHFLASLKYLSQFRQVRKIKEKDLVENSILFMKEHINMRLSLDDLAEKVKASPSNYSSVFRKKTGRPPLDYFIHLKIQHACSLLDYTSLQIKEIALKVGYEDPYYFSRIFKKVMNLSPKEYRLNLKG